MLIEQREAFIKANLPKGASSQVRSVLGRIAMVAVAGEMAINLDILPWPSGEAESAAKSIFAAWLKNRGGAGAMEVQDAVSQVQIFLELHGSSKFEQLLDTLPLDTRTSTLQDMMEAEKAAIPASLEALDEKNHREGASGRIFNRAGYWRWTEGPEPEKQFLIFPEVWSEEVCKGLDAKAVAAALLEQGYLERGDGKHLTRKVTVEGFRKRFYCVSNSITGRAVDEDEA